MNKFIEELKELPSQAKVALEKARKLETRRLKKGYRYIRVSPHTTLLIECDKDGNPTEKGLEHLNMYKQRSSKPI